MVRQFGRTADYQPVSKLTETRVDISFDLVYYKNEEGDEDRSLGTWSKHSYFAKPTTEQMQHDVISYTIQRYVNEGLEPPKPEDIDVSKYVID